MKRGTKRKRRSQKQRKPSTLHRTHHRGRKGRPAAARRGAKKKDTDPCFEKRTVAYIKQFPESIYYTITKVDDLNTIGQETIYIKPYPEAKPNCYDVGFNSSGNNYRIKELGNYVGQRGDEMRFKINHSENTNTTLVNPGKQDIYEGELN